MRKTNTGQPFPTALDSLSLRRIGSFLSVWKPSTTRNFSMEATHGSPTRRESSFLSCRCSRSSQSTWPTAFPVGHSRLGVLCRHVWREKLHRHWAMGTRPRHRPDASTWFHAQTSKDGRHSQGSDRVGPEGLRGRAEPVGRIVTEHARLERAFATRSLRARWQDSSWQLRRSRQGGPPALLGGSRIGANVGSETGSQRRRKQDQRAQDSSPVAPRHRSRRAIGNRRRYVLPA